MDRRQGALPCCQTGGVLRDVGPDDGEDPGTLDRSGYELEFDETFTEPGLDPGRWVAHYLPHWTTPERSAARYELEPGVLRLRIDADQPAWRSEDGEMRVSNIQTGTFAGPLGSSIGQHRHRPDLAVRTPQATRPLYTPSFGLSEAVLRAGPDPTCMLAFWLVGFEEQSPSSSGEICVAELFGHSVYGSRSPLVGELTLAVLVSEPLAGTVTTTVRLLLWPLARLPRLQFTMPLLFTPLPLALTKVTVAGRLSVTTTLLATDVPRLVTDIV